MSNVLDIMINSAKLSSSPFNYSSGHFLAFSYIRYIEIFVICCNAGFFISSKYFKSWRFRQVLKASSQTNCRKRLCLSSFQKDKSRKHKTKSSQNNSLVLLYQSTYKVLSKESIWFTLFCWVCHILLFCSSLGCYSYLVENLRQWSIVRWVLHWSYFHPPLMLSVKYLSLCFEVPAIFVSIYFGENQWR